MALDNQTYTATDTICAISTPTGSGGIAVIRISGNDAIHITNKIWQGKDLQKVASHTAHLGKIIDTNGDILDQAVAVIYRNPASYTGEDVVELSVHGSKYIQAQLLTLLVNSGCRLALPGEFTQRAFTAGRFDLAQAEAVADIIASNSKASHRLALSQIKGVYSQKIEQMRAELLQLASLLELELDFAEEDVEFASRDKLLHLADSLSAQLQAAADSFRTGQAIKDGIPIALVGATNAGKSSLLNALVDDDRAIVSDIHGTTRDIIEETISCGDYLLRLQDTAGLRHTNDPIEQLGIDRTVKAAHKAGVVIYVVDTSDISSLPALPDIDHDRLIIAANKIDKKTDLALDVINATYQDVAVIPCSALQHKGIEDLRQAITTIIERHNGNTDIIVANARHAQAFTDTAENLRTFATALRQGIPTDLAAQHLRQAITALSTITGTITTPEILQNIFSQFCIGK